MDRHALDYLYTRTRVESLHLQAIRNDSSKITDDVGKIIDTVFGHLPAQFVGSPPIPYPLDDNTSRVPSTEWIAWHFYKHFYCVPKVHRDFLGVELGLDKFLATLTSFGTSKNRNNLFFLQGIIGSGKTAFINYLITNHGADCFENKDTWFLRLNVDTIDHTQKDSEIPLIDFFQKSSEKLIRVLRKMCAKDFCSSKEISVDQMSQIGSIIGKLEKRLIQNGLEKHTRCAHLRSAFSAAIQETNVVLNKRLLLILDNLDAFFHERDRYLFLSDVDTGEDVYVKAILNIVSEFYHGNGEMGDIGVNVLFVLRPDSYEILKNSRLIYQGAEDAYKDNRALYTLYNPSWKSIVLERSNLLQKTIENISKQGTRKEVDKALDNVVKALADGTRVANIISHLQQLVTFGLRSVMNFFQQYTWLNEDGHEWLPTTRYIQNVPVGLICFILQNNRLYSQKESGFPNVYYVNVDKDESKERNKEISGLLGGETLNPEHSHTFWLKRLMLLYISTRNKIGAKVQTADVVDLFAPENDGYDRGLVRLCLGSFSQTHLSNLCNVKRQLSTDKSRLIVGHIELTDRARYCIDNLFDRFAYLQLIVDDYDLPLPTRCAETFKYHDNRNYGYLVKEGDSYIARAEDMVKHKAIQVTKFLAMLTVAYDIEKIRYSAVFEQLKAINIDFPNPEKNFKSFIEELSSLKKATLFHNPARSVDVDKLKERYVVWKDILRPELEKAYGY